MEGNKDQENEEIKGEEEFNSEEIEETNAEEWVDDNQESVEAEGSASDNSDGGIQDSPSQSEEIAVEPEPIIEENPLLSAQEFESWLTKFFMENAPLKRKYVSDIVGKFLNEQSDVMEHLQRKYSKEYRLKMRELNKLRKSEAALSSGNSGGNEDGSGKKSGMMKVVIIVVILAALGGGGYFFKDKIMAMFGGHGSKEHVEEESDHQTVSESEQTHNEDEAGSTSEEESEAVEATDESGDLTPDSASTESEIHDGHDH